MAINEDIGSLLTIIGELGSRVNPNWNGQGNDLESSKEAIEMAVAALGLSRAADTLATTIVGISATQLNKSLVSALSEGHNSSKARDLVRTFTESAPETDPASLYWGLMALYNAARKRG